MTPMSRFDARATAVDANHAAIDVEALTVAMAMAPGIYARNRHFSLYDDPRFRRARARASLLRGLVRQLTGAEGPLDEVAIERSPARLQLRYRVARVRMHRTAELTPTEAACVFHLATRAGASGVAPTPGDKTRLFTTLSRLVASHPPSAAELGQLTSEGS
jgi:hypothetical protein